VERQIVTDFERLHRDGAYIADGYLADAVKAVDAQFGDGFSKCNAAAAAPMIAAYMATTVASYTTMGRAKVDEGITAALCGSLDGVAAAITEIAIELRQNGA
jgi:hypothetical protein